MFAADPMATRILTGLADGLSAEEIRANDTFAQQGATDALARGVVFGVGKTVFGLKGLASFHYNPQKLAPQTEAGPGVNGEDGSDLTPPR
jgi:hypothetical protein